MDLSALFNVLIAERREATAVAQHQAFKLQLVVFVESLKQTIVCILKEGVAYYRLLPCLGFMQISEVSKDEK